MVTILIFSFIMIASTLKLPLSMTQPRMGCTWKYSIVHRSENTSIRFNLDELFLHSAPPKFPIMLETFPETRSIPLNISASISRRSDQCKVHIVIVMHFPLFHLPTVTGEDKAETLVYITPDGWHMSEIIVNKHWLGFIDHIRDIFVLTVNYDINKITVLRAFQHQPNEVVEYDPTQGM